VILRIKQRFLRISNLGKVERDSADSAYILSAFLSGYKVRYVSLW
jgi:hypothetical protein